MNLCVCGGEVTTQRVTGDKWRFFKDSFGTLYSPFLGLWCVLNGINPSSEGSLNIDAICCHAICYHWSPTEQPLPCRRGGEAAASPRGGSQQEARENPAVGVE